MMNSDSLGVVFSEAFYRRIGPDWGETTSGAKSERNLRSLRGWREKLLKTKRGEFRVCCKSEVNELAESKPESKDLRNRKLFTKFFGFASFQTDPPKRSG